jgi:hypothetical protein
MVENKDKINLLKICDRKKLKRQGVPKRPKTLIKT